MPQAFKLPSGAEGASVADFSALGPLEGPAVGLISLLTKQARQANLARHLDTLKGTIYEPAAQAAAKRWPRVFGHIGSVSTGRLKGTAGTFAPDRAQVGAPYRRGHPVGDIELKQPGLLDRLLGGPKQAADTLGHELTHGAQALMKRPGRFTQQYQAAEQALGYADNPYELGAQKGGAHLQQLLDSNAPVRSALSRKVRNGR